METANEVWKRILETEIISEFEKYTTIERLACQFFYLFGKDICAHELK